MILQELGKTVAQYAPLLGSVLPIPGGTAIGAIIAHEFGVDANDTEALINKITTDPDARIKLLDIQTRNQQRLEELAIEKAKHQQAYELDYARAILQDKSDARKTQAENDKAGKHNYIPEILVASIITGLFMTFGAFCYFVSHDYKLDAPTIAVFASVGSLLLQKFSTILDFYFGSSLQEKRAQLKVS